MNIGFRCSAHSDKPLVTRHSRFSHVILDYLIIYTHCGATETTLLHQNNSCGADRPMSARDLSMSLIRASHYLAVLVQLVRDYKLR